MSKSKGNVIDPLDMIDGISLQQLLAKRTDTMMQPQRAEKISQRTAKQFPQGIKPHGTDALRFTLAALAATGRDINWDMKRLEGYRNFCNKLWNASRFVLMNTEASESEPQCDAARILSLADRWILAKFNQTVHLYREAIDSYRFDLAASTLYDFTWNQFCDWYLELSKPVLNSGSPAQLRGTRHTLIEVLEALLRLAHPIIPFITETLWQQLKQRKGITGETIMLQPFPHYDASLNDPHAVGDLEWIQQMVTAVRNIRAEMNIPPAQPLEALLLGATVDVTRRVQEQNALIQAVARLTTITLLPAGEKGPVSVSKRIEGAQLLIPMARLIDKPSEIARLTREAAKLDSEISAIEAKLSNAGFITRAPETVVSNERARLAACTEAAQKLAQQLATIRSL